MNYVSHPKIRAAIQASEKIDIRGERHISLYRLREELVKRNVAKKDFMDYLYRYISNDMNGYVVEVSNKLFDQYNEISRDEKFLITSGLC